MPSFETTSWSREDKRKVWDFVNSCQQDLGDLVEGQLNRVRREFPGDPQKQEQLARELISQHKHWLEGKPSLTPTDSSEDSEAPDRAGEQEEPAPEPTASEASAPASQPAQRAESASASARPLLEPAERFQRFSRWGAAAAACSSSAAPSSSTATPGHGVSSSSSSAAGSGSAATRALHR